VKSAFRAPRLLGRSSLMDCHDAAIRVTQRSKTSSSQSNWSYSRRLPSWSHGEISPANAPWRSGCRAYRRPRLGGAARRAGQNDASAKCRCYAGGREGRAGIRMRSRSGWLRLKRFDELNPYAAAVLFVTFVGALTAGLGVAVFAAFAFSFAANSCLTVAVIAATSTL